MNRQMIMMICAMFLLALSMPAAASQNSPDTKTCAALVDDRTITVESFQNTLVRLRASKDIERMLDTFSPQGKEKLLNEMIVNKLLAVDAQKRKLDQDPKIRAAIQEAIDQVLAEALIREEIDSLNLGDSPLKRFYQDNTDMFRLPDRIKARHIITRTRPEAQAALDRVTAGEDFQAVASEVNIDATKAKAGDLGLVPAGIMVKPFEDALFGLSEGEISGVVKTSFGFHIILAEKIEKGSLRPFETVREDIRQHIINTHLEQVRKNLREHYHVWINRELLEKSDK